MSLQNIDALNEIKIRARGNVFNLADVIRNYRVLLIGVPGAFTPVDTNVYMPELIQTLPYLDQRIDYIFCVTWNDPFVTKSWVVSLDIPKKIKMISDWNGYLTKSLGMDMDAGEYYLGFRSKRYAAIYDNGELLWHAEADDAYPSNIREAVQTFKHWKPSNGQVDPCSTFTIDKSPKSKFTEINFLPVSSFREQLNQNPETSKPELSAQESSEAPTSPSFKTRFGSPRGMVMSRSLASLHATQPSDRSYSEGGTEEPIASFEEYYSSSEEPMNESVPPQSISLSRTSPATLRISIEESSDLSDVDLVESARFSRGAGGRSSDVIIASEEMLEDRFLENAIDTVLDDMMKLSTEGTDSLGIVSPRSELCDSPRDTLRSVIVPTRPSRGNSSKDV